MINSDGWKDVILSTRFGEEDCFLVFTVDAQSFELQIVDASLADLIERVKSNSCTFKYIISDSTLLIECTEKLAPMISRRNFFSIEKRLVH